jgi:DNA-binding GntR family transcriptional regulator
VKAQVSLLHDSSAQVRDQARREIKTYGRFYEPILKRILENELDPKARAPIERALASSSEVQQ